MPADANPLSSAELSTFVVAMETGGVHAAADALGLTASAVTKRLQALERRTGAQLFERTSRGLRSTPAGRVLYPEAKAALAALDRAGAALREHQGHGAHAVLLAASHTIGEFLLPEWLAAFRAGRSAARAQIDIVNSPGVLVAVRAREAQIGFVEGTDTLDGLESMVVQRDEIVAVVAGDHRWARRRSVRAHELRDEPYLAREAGSGTRAVATAALAAADIEITPALEVASSQSLKRAVSSGGFALMSRLALTAEAAAGTLRPLQVADLELERDLLAVRDPDVPLRSGTDTAALWRFLRAMGG